MDVFLLQKQRKEPKVNKKKSYVCVDQINNSVTLMCPYLFFSPSSEGSVDDFGTMYQVWGWLLICFM